MKRGAWAGNVAAELRKHFQPGQEFTVQDSYCVVPALQALYPNNRTIRGRLRVMIAYDLVCNGTIQRVKHGRYRMA